jgi:hypothetical protein
LSISTPYGSAGGSYGSFDSNESTKGEKKAQQSVRLAWQARGGDTLLCSRYATTLADVFIGPMIRVYLLIYLNSPTLWANTVKDYRLWRIMDVRLCDLVCPVSLC